MSVLKSKRNMSPTEYEKAFFELYDYLSKSVSTVSKRKQKWVCEDICKCINKVCRNIMNMTSYYNPNKEVKQKHILFIRDDCVNSLLSLEKSLMVYWNIQSTEQRKIYFCVELINRVLKLLRGLGDGSFTEDQVEILNWDAINRVEFLKNMSELHRYTYTKLVGANKAFDSTHGTVLAGLVDDAFYHLIIANRCVPSTKEEYERRRDNISSAISCLNSLNTELLFYYNLMKYSERVMTEWSSMLAKELKLLCGLQRSDKDRFSKLN